MMANFCQWLQQVAILFVAIHRIWCAEDECSYRDLKPQCGTDQLKFTHTNGSITFDIEQAMYPSGTKVFAECHRYCQGRSSINDPAGVRECRLGKWQGCFDKCFCGNAMGKKARCMQTSLRRGFRNRTKAQWRRYRSSIQCCHICSLSNRNEADSSERCQSFNLKLNEFGVECQFFNETDPNPKEDNQSSYFEIAGDCDALFVPNGVSIPPGTKNQTAVHITCNTGFSSIHNKVSCQDGVFKAHGSGKNESVITITCYRDCKGLVVSNGTNVTATVHHEEEVDIKCEAGLSTYYAKAVCNNGIFKPSRAICGRYPQIGDPTAMRWQGQFFKRIYNKPLRWDTASNLCKNAHKNGIMATVLSAELLLRFAKIATITGKYYAIGMIQKKSQNGMGVGWQWINTGTNATIDIDSSKTPKLIWYDGEPNDRTPGESNQENFGSILWSGNRLRFNDAPLHPNHEYVICQIDYPVYEFTLVKEGSKLAFPHESSLVGVSLENCTESCLNSAFCRAFSYSAKLSDCWHHSTPPSDPEAKVESDENYNIYG